ncbi:hypothetical protein SDC9_88183 [bioreactor metagenome]|uniref:Uncharacterized protein n=1 Tax=bioreactor metagenome TaxID=1076179 RepID=A0A644ZMD5_9ZZZZ
MGNGDVLHGVTDCKQGAHIADGTADIERNAGGRHDFPRHLGNHGLLVSRRIKALHFEELNFRVDVINCLLQGLNLLFVVLFEGNGCGDAA